MFYSDVRAVNTMILKDVQYMFYKYERTVKLAEVTQTQTQTQTQFIIVN
jgi:hypothetical protein